MKIRQKNEIRQKTSLSSLKIFQFEGFLAIIRQRAKRESRSFKHEAKRSLDEEVIAKKPKTSRAGRKLEEEDDRREWDTRQLGPVSGREWANF